MVADSSAVLALVFGEGDSVRIRDILRGASMATPNLAEVAQKLAELGNGRTDIEALLWQLGLAIEPFDAFAAVRTGVLRAANSSSGLSLADFACLELGLRHGSRVVTTDRAWTKVDVGVEVVLIR